MTYWEQRTADAAARQDAAIARALPELTSALQEARRELQKEIEAFWSRYAKNNAVSLADAQKALSLEELADFKGDLNTFRRLAKRSIGTFNLEVENLSVKARVTRLEALQAQCGAILQRCYQRQREAIEAAAQGLAVEQYDHALYDIEQYTGFQSSYAQLPTRAIRQMLAMPVQGSDLSSALWRQDMDTGFQIRRMLGLMFTTGRPPQDFARELQRIIGRRDAEGNLTGKTYEAYRLLYNESAHVSEQAKLAAYGEDGIEELEIVATLDSKTCGDCGPRDGKRIKVKDAVEGVNIPPFHVNCRCSTAPYVAAAQGSFARTRAARDPVTGKTVRVKAQTFEEWKRGRDERTDAYDVIDKTGGKGKEAQTAFEAEYNRLLPNHRAILDKGLQAVTIEERTGSVTSSSTGAIKLRPTLDAGEATHELGHSIAAIKNLYSDPEFLKVLANGLPEIQGLDDLLTAETGMGSRVRLLWSENSKFLTPYQSMSSEKDYEKQPRFDAHGRFNIKTLREYFSVGFQAFYETPALLQQKDSGLYLFIKGLK